MRSEYFALGLFTASALATGMLLTGTPLPPAEAVAQSVVKNVADEIASRIGADETAIDMDNLIRIGDGDYRVAVADGYDYTAISQTVVRKIGFGKVTNVQVVATNAGSLSTDALTSRNVLYPGIRVEDDRPEAGSAGDFPAALVPFGGVVLALEDLPSFLTIATRGTAQTLVTDQLTCIQAGSTVTCS